MTRRSLTSVAALVAIGVATTVAWTQQARGPGSGFPDLVGGLEHVEGCIGVETARTRSGKQVIFAWFEDKAAVLRWYYSETHLGAVDFVISGDGNDGLDATKPLSHVPDDTGPIMVIASITPSETPTFQGLDMPVSEIAIELYKPLPGGAFLGGRLAPVEFEVPHMKDFTPVSRD